MRSFISRPLPVLLVILVCFCAAGTGAQEKFWREAVGASRARAIGSVPNSFADLAEKTKPAVVTVYTRKSFKGLGFFFPREFVQEGAGSGFILSPDGYIVTNYHVVKGSESIKVMVGVENKKEYEAELKGSDPQIDIALIKIEAKGLPTLPLGDSDALRVGDWVAAIGSPFNFTHTLTVGVVSAKGRRLGLGNYEDFIQTDASINSGNSGGPLMNLRGEVVGVNTLIISPTGGNVGIGFATPINLVKSILVQLKEKGKVTRSWLGVTIGPVSEEEAAKAGLDKNEGARVVQVVVGSPADDAGIEVGDIIVGFNNKKVEEFQDLPAMVSSYGVGSEAEISWIRDEKRMSQKVELEKLPGREQLAKLKVRGRASADNILGVAARDIRPEDRERLRLPETKGALVVEVKPGSPAAQNGIRPGDVIVKIEFMDISDVEDFNRAVKKIDPGEYVRIKIRRGNATTSMMFRVPEE